MKRYQAWVLSLLLSCAPVAAQVLPAAPLCPAPPPNPAHAPYLIARLAPGTDIELAMMRAELQTAGLAVRRQITFRHADQLALAQNTTGAASVLRTSAAPVFLLLEPSTQRTNAEWRASLLAMKHFADVEPDSELRFSRLPNDLSPGLAASGQQWHLNNVYKPQQGPGPSYLFGADINAIYAWDVGMGTRKTVVAIIDDGMFYLHPDLKDNAWRNPAETPGDCQDNDDDGLVDDVYGADFGPSSGPDGDPIPITPESHGTMVAGALGAVGDNGIGTIGAIPFTQMMAVKVADSPDGSFALSATLQAYAFIALKKEAGINVRVVNASYGSAFESPSARDAIAYLGTLDILFVAAAGNTGTSEFQYPASYLLPNVLSVGASTSDDRRAVFSSYGSRVDLAAPGERIYTTSGDFYASPGPSGTSFAAPLVAGAAALLMDTEPSLDAKQVRARIVGSIDHVDSLATYFPNGGGRLNMARMLGVDLPSRPPAFAYCPPTLPAPHIADYAEVSARDARYANAESPVPGTAQRLQMLQSQGGPGFASCNFPLIYTAVLPDNSERTLTGVGPFGGYPLSGLLDFPGAVTTPAIFKVRTEASYRYRKVYGPPQLGTASFANVSPTEVLTDESLSLQGPVANDVDFFKSNRELGQVRSLLPPPTIPPITYVDGWILEAVLNQVQNTTQYELNKSVHLAQPFTMLGHRITDVQLLDPAKDPGKALTLVFCDRPCNIRLDQNYDPVAPSFKYAASPYWFSLRLDGDMFKLAAPADLAGYYWQRTRLLASRVDRPAVGPLRETLMFATTAGVGSGAQWGPAAFPTTEEASFRLIFSAATPNEVQLVLTRRVRDQASMDLGPKAKVQAYFKSPDFEFAVPAATASYVRNPALGSAGAFYSYEQAWRLSSLPSMAASFADVPSSSPLFMSVEGVGRTGVMLSCGGGNFCPAGAVTRGEAAAFLARAWIGRDSRINYASAPLANFADVPANHPFARYIGRLAEKGVLTECGAGNFCPDAPITRYDLARWLYAIRALPSARTFDLLDDVPSSDPNAAMIEGVSTWGVIAPCGERRFCPAQAIARGEMASILQMAFMPFAQTRGF